MTGQDLQTGFQRRVRVLIDRVQRIVGHDGIASEPRTAARGAKRDTKSLGGIWRTSVLIFRERPRGLVGSLTAP
jgi:hypothetical protein